MGKTILRQQGRLLRRAGWVRGFDLFLETAFLLTILSAATLLTDRFLFEADLSPLRLARPALAGTLLAWALLLSGLVAAFRAFLRPLSPIEVTWKADRWLAADAGYLHAVEIAQAGPRNDFERLVLTVGETTAGKMEPRKILPSPPLRYRWGILLALVSGGTLMALPPIEAHPPVADYSVEPLRGCAPLTVRALESCIGYIDSFEWDFGDGKRESGRLLTHRYDKPGRYAVRLRVRGPGGRAEVSRLTVEVLAREYVVSDFDPQPAKGRAPLTVFFRNRSQNTDSFRWSFGDQSGSATPEPTHLFSQPGRYEVELTARGGGAEDRTTKIVHVAGPDEPLADFAAHPTKGKKPLTVQFESRATGEIESQEWDFGDPLEPTGSEENPSHTYVLPGTYTVKLRVKGPGGEDTEVKERYIRVDPEGDDQGTGSGGGGGGGTGMETDPATGEEQVRPKVDPIPESVRAPGSGPHVDKKKKVYAAGSEGGGGGEEPYEQAYGRYQRAAEEALERERIPESARDYVRKYFEAIRPDEERKP